MEKDLVPQLLQIFHRAKKAADMAAKVGATGSGPEEERCLDALNQLKQIPITGGVVVPTQIGNGLRQLINHPCKRIQALSTDVMQTLKNHSHGAEEDKDSKKQGNQGLKIKLKVPPVSVATGSPTSCQLPNPGDHGIGSPEVEAKMEEAKNTKKQGNQGSKIRLKLPPVSDATGSPASCQKPNPGGRARLEVEATKEEAKDTKKQGNQGSKIRLKLPPVSDATGSPTSFQKPNSGGHGGLEVEAKTEEVNDTKKQGKQGNQGSKIGVKHPAVSVATPSLASFQKTNDIFRDTIREIFVESLGKVTDEADNQTLKEAVSACDFSAVAVTLETELFKVWGSYNGPKKLKYRSVMFNIKDETNRDFRRKVLLGLFPPNIVSTLTADDMASSETRLNRNKIRENTMFDCGLVQSADAGLMDMKCGRCGKNQTIYHQMKTRRADEPMTTFVTCLKCNHHWRF